MGKKRWALRERLSGSSGVKGERSAGDAALVDTFALALRNKSDDGRKGWFIIVKTVE